MEYGNDPEKGANGHSFGGDVSPDHDAALSAGHQPWRQRFVDSFKRDPNAHVTKAAQAIDATEGRAVKGFDHKAAAQATADPGLAHKLKGRHMQMIAIGGSIGELQVKEPHCVAL